MLVCEKVLGSLGEYEPEADEVEHVTLADEQRRRSRVRTETDAGTEVGILCDDPLRDGDVIHDGDVAVVVSLESLDAYEIDLRDVPPNEAACIGHDLGNIHLKMAFGDGYAYVPVTPDSTRYIRRELSEEAGLRKVGVRPSVFDDDRGDEHHGGHSHG